VLPRDVAGLLAGQENLSSGGRSRVRVVEVPQGDGSSAWIVQLPGTQEWSPAPGDNLADLTSNALLMAQRSTLLGAAVTDALDQSMAATGRDTSAERVMLVGHSQGGIAAAALAASPGFRQRHRVTHVMAAGAPIARFPIPADVGVLALEHRQDPVPRLDGATNPDRPSWVTATRDVAGDPEVGRRASRAHDLGEYRQTAAAVGRHQSGSFGAWRRSATPFFAGDSHGAAVVRDYRLARVLGRP
jgi:pimeloyl-ACP methyl ester carboxylesterase